MMVMIMMMLLVMVMALVKMITIGPQCLQQQNGTKVFLKSRPTSEKETFCWRLLRIEFIPGRILLLSSSFIRKPMLIYEGMIKKVSFDSLKSYSFHIHKKI